MSKDDNQVILVDKDEQEVIVTQKEGLFCSIMVRAKVPLPPTEVYDILTDPDNVDTFKNMKAVLYKKIIADNGRGDITMEVEQEGRWKFLIFSGSFPVRLHVEQSRSRGFIRFKLIKAGFMKVFEGEWNITKYNSHDPTHKIGKLAKEAEKAAQRRATESNEASSSQDGKKKNKSLAPTHHRFPHLPSFDLGSLADRALHSHRRRQASIVTLSQDLRPAIIPPPPIDSYLRKIAAKVTQSILADLQAEARRTVERRQRTEQQQAADRSEWFDQLRRMIPGQGEGLVGKAASLPPRTASIITSYWGRGSLWF